MQLERYSITNSQTYPQLLWISG